MSDKYILRSGAIDAIKRNAGTLYTRETEFLFRKVISLLKNAPAADVAEVVHCRDCKHKMRTIADGFVLCAEKHGMVKPTENDFCSYGKRRDDDVSD